MTGKSILDVGSAQGYFCFEALERGASRAVGWEIDSNRLRQARAIAEMRKSPVEFHELNIEEDTPQEAFDIVLLLNVLHHLSDPIAVLDKLIQVTRETLILEIASFGRHDRKRLGLSIFQSWVCNRAPVILVEKKKQTYYFTRKAIRNFFYQRPYFAQTDIFDSDFKNRFFIKALRHLVKNVVVVTGPIGSGKSKLIQEILANNITELGEQPGLTSDNGWIPLEARKIRTLEQSLPDKIILHYDFIRPDKKKIKSYQQDNVMQLLAWANEISILTLWTPPEKLQKRFNETKLQPRLQKRDQSSPKKKKRIQGFRHILETYQQPDKITDSYKKWFDFCESHFSQAQNHIIVEFDEQLRIISHGEWEEEIRK
ncbi:MAG: methyltransferase domain-containing protein [bacterium]